MAKHGSPSPICASPHSSMTASLTMPCQREQNSTKQWSKCSQATHSTANPMGSRSSLPPWRTKQSGMAGCTFWWSQRILLNLMKTSSISFTTMGNWLLTKSRHMLKLTLINQKEWPRTLPNSTTASWTLWPEKPRQNDLEGWICYWWHPMWNGPPQDHHLWEPCRHPLHGPPCPRKA